MPEILRRGKLPEERKITVDCSNCHSTIRFTVAEMRTLSDPRDGITYAGECPVCKHAVYGYPPVHSMYDR